MGPEDNEFKITPGHVWLVPIDDEGRLHGEPQEVTRVDFDWGEEDGWGDDSGYEEGLDGGLQGGPDGALSQIDVTGWSVELTFSGEISDETMALLWGLSLEAYLDLKQWWAEARWLSCMTDGEWNLV